MILKKERKKNFPPLTYFDALRGYTVNQPLLPQGRKPVLPLFPYL